MGRRTLTVSSGIYRYPAVSSEIDCKDRVTVLPESLLERLRAHRDRIRELHEKDRAEDIAGVWMPEALERKYPKAELRWEWFWLFPSRQLLNDPRSGLRRRHHVLDATFQEAIRQGARRGASSTRESHRTRCAIRSPAPAGKRDRHPHSAGSAWARRCRHDADLYPRDG